MTVDSKNNENATKKSFSFQRLLMGSFLVDKKSITQLPYVLYLGLLAIISIASSHCADKKVFDVAKLNTELREVRSAYVTTKRKLMLKSKQSVIEAKAAKQEIFFSEEPPTIVESK